MTRRVAVHGLAALFILQALPGMAQSQEKYKARLAPVPIDIAMRSTVAGTGSVTAVLAGAKLTVEGTFDGLVSPATTAAVHRGPAMGVRGPSLGALTASKALKGTLSGSIDLTPAQVEALKKGQLYIQVSSEKAPDGNLWGWFVR